MLFGCMSSEEDVMPDLFFEQGLRFNSDGCVRILEMIVKPWITRVANNGRLIPHDYKNYQIRMDDNFYVFTSPNQWPLNSPDLNLLDYYDNNPNRSSCNTGKAELMVTVKFIAII
uniref:Uncharacterized protein n=1 Tax=Anopheles funestus TaxID=62324 RepID=A0A182RK46_ANOFN